MSIFITSTSYKSRKVALMLCLFGGLFGLHYFYVGRIGKGLLYIFTMGFFMIGWLVDIFKILIGRFEDQYGDYLIEW